jgi:hypothetical protein
MDISFEIEEQIGVLRSDLNYHPRDYYYYYYY